MCEKNLPYIFAWVLLHAAALVLSVWGCAVVRGIAEQGLVVKVKVKMCLKCARKRNGRKAKEVEKV
jgi:hypothetical protein